MTEENDIQIDPLKLLESQKKAEARVQSMSREHWLMMRRRCKTDLFFLTHAVLGYNKLSENLHGHLCSWMMRNRSPRFRLLLLPRGHYKSTIWTISDSIRIILPDDQKDQPWPESLGTDCRLVIIHETIEQASKFLIPITAHITSNTLLMGLFPEIVPSPREHRISKFELELPRSQKWPEPTIDTLGVGARGQGRHYNQIKADDLIGDKARDSKAEMETAIEWFDNIQSFFSEFNRDKLDLTGTRWAVNDLYKHVIKTYGPAILKYIRPAEEYNPITKQVEPIFPESFDSKAFEILKKNKKIWNSQYANNPEEGDSKFEKGWKRYYQLHPTGKIIVFTGDERLVLDVMSLDLNILFDPSEGGKGGLLVTGTHHSGRHFILEAIKAEQAHPAWCDLVFKLVRKWRPRTVAIEKVLFSAIYETWFKAEMKLRGIKFHITMVEPKGKEKKARVMGLTNYFQAGLIYFLQEQEDLDTEYDEFGNTEDYHLLDALAYGPFIWRGAFDPKVMDSYKEVEASILAGMDPVTGYSLI